jgi:CheY-like chemotaxis protein
LETFSRLVVGDDELLLRSKKLSACRPQKFADAVLDFTDPVSGNEMAPRTPFNRAVSVQDAASEHLSDYSASNISASATDYALPSSVPESGGSPKRDIASPCPPPVSSTVLVADDDHVIRKVFSRILEVHGYKVDTAVNGQEALDMIRARAQSGQPMYNVVMVDMIMPLMSGLEVAQHVRKMGLNDLPIIACTASLGLHRGRREQLIAAGITDTLSKPANRAELISMVDRWRNGIRAAAGQ